MPVDSDHSPDLKASGGKPRRPGQARAAGVGRRELHIGVPSGLARTNPPERGLLAADETARRVHVIVPYARFMARRRLRQRVAAELAGPPDRRTPGEEI